MSISAVLGDAFRETQRRPAPVVLDLIWKLIWLVVTISMIGAAAAWMYADVGSLQIESQNLNNPIAVMLLARQVWQQYGVIFMVASGILLGTSGLIWVLLEAYFRSGALPNSGRTFFPTARTHFGRFIACSCFKQWILFVIFILIGVVVFGQFLKTPIGEWRTLWPDVRGPALVAGLLFITFWFISTVFETVIRLDALDLFGRELFAVTGVIGTLLLFEGMILVSAIGLGTVLLALISGMTRALVLLLGYSAGGAFLVLLHSCLVVVRYRAINLLRGTSSVPEVPGIIGHVDEFRDHSHPRFWFPVHSTDRTPHS